MKNLFIGAAIFLASTAAWACKGVEAVDGWIREAPPGAHMLAGYITLENNGRKSRRLDAVRSADFGLVEVHETSMVDGRMQMREVKNLALPRGARVKLEPGGMHLMLMQPVRTLKAGDTVDLSFQCGRQAPLKVSLPVRSALEP